MSTMRGAGGKRKSRVTARSRARAGDGPPPSGTHDELARIHEQLQLYASDLNRTYRSERRKTRELETAQKQLLKYASDLRLSYESEKRRAAEVQAAYREALYRLTIAAEYKDEETAEHIQRISHYARTVAEAIGWSAAQQQTIFDAAPMHDVGKIGIQDAVLLKAGPLTPDEWQVMKAHPLMGEKILAESDSSLLRMGAAIAASHHERFDGTGYPHGLKGEAIPLVGRIVMLCDIYDALRSRRPYKQAFDHDKACDIILSGDGRTRPEHFDPALLAVFGQVKDSFAETFARLSDA